MAPKWVCGLTTTKRTVERQSGQHPTIPAPSLIAMRRRLTATPILGDLLPTPLLLVTGTGRRLRIAKALLTKMTIFRFQRVREAVPWYPAAS